jgi:transcriptional regulator NrdR family protein
MIDLSKLKVKKKNKKLQKFDIKKIKRGMMRSGASTKLATEATEAVLRSIKRTIKRGPVSYLILGRKVIAALQRRNKRVAKSFKKFFESRL